MIEMKNRDRIELIVKLLVKNSDDIKAAVDHFATVGISVITEKEQETIQEKSKHETSQQKLIKALKSKVSDTNLKDENLIKIITYFKSTVYPKKETLEEELQKVLENFYQTDLLPKCYPRPKRNGYALIINQIKFSNPKLEDRYGAKNDQEKMYKVLKNCGYEVEVFIDETKSELTKKISDRVKNKLSSGTEEYDSLIVVVSSHGIEDDYFATKDSKFSTFVSSWKEIVEKFNCPRLEGKPKIFLFNFCRGDMDHEGVSNIQSDGVPEFSIPQSWSDMLVCFSTVDGYKSLRSVTEGSCFLTFISQDFESHGDKEDICTVLARVSEKLKRIGNMDQKQMCTYYNIGFSKEFYLK